MHILKPTNIFVQTIINLFLYTDTMKKFYLLFWISYLRVMAFHAQQKITDAGLIRLLKLQDSLRSRLPIEKLYLQTDKPVYAVGDTIWFKGYTFDADYLKYSSRSGLIYIELANDNNEVVFRRMAARALWHQPRANSY